MFDWLKRSWKIVTGIAGGLAIILSLFSFSDRFVTQDSLAADQKLQDVKQEMTVKNLQIKQEMDNQKMQYQFNAIRYTTLTDLKARLEVMIRSNPKDTQLREELRKVNEERDKVFGEMKK